MPIPKQSRNDKIGIHSMRAGRMRDQRVEEDDKAMSIENNNKESVSNKTKYRLLSHHS